MTKSIECRATSATGTPTPGAHTQPRSTASPGESDVVERGPHPFGCRCAACYDELHPSDCNCDECPRHEAPNTYSNLLYKGAIKDTGHTIFFGNLVVPPGAPGTDAYQTNRNLVLNEGARADTIPFLEIETAEVKCSHAGAISRVDDEHLFYLESRGVPRDAAKQLIVEGFCQEVLDEVELTEIRDELNAAIERKVRS